MFCTNCGAQLPDGSKFCTKCGTPLRGDAAGGAGEGAQSGWADETRAMPGAAPAPEPDSVAAQQVAPDRSGRGLVVAAIIMGVLAVAAVVALVVVVIDPFGLHLLDGGSGTTASQEQPQTSGEPEQGGTEQAEPGEAKPEGTDQTDSEQAEKAEPEGAEQTEPEQTEPEGTESESEPAPAEDSGTYVLPDSASRLYSADELSGLSDWQLYIARNEIYARHGREFRNQDLQDYFNGQSWYTPLYSPDQFDSMGLLSSIEQQNASTILSVEKARGSQYV